MLLIIKTNNKTKKKILIITFYSFIISLTTKSLYIYIKCLHHLQAETELIPLHPYQ